MHGITFDIAHMLAGTLVLVSFMMLYQDRLSALLNIFALHALVLALSLYTGSYIAEIVRAGVQSVARGQSEAAAALGLNEAQTRKWVIVPQAMRIIMPPLISQYLALTKNSSLAAFVGFADLMQVSGTILNQTGAAVQVIGLAMAIYLVLSLATLLVLRLYERRFSWSAAR